MSRPLLLDLFCCEGGAAAGYHRAGFDVVGVDLEPQQNYPFEFHQADALDLPFSQFELDQFDAVHASPPCQGYSTMSNRHGSTIPQLIEPVRDLLTVIGLPWVIENVAGARPHLRSPITIHGGHVGLNVYRPRLFESNVLLCPPPKAARPKDAAAIYGKNDRRRIWTRKDGTELRAASLDEAREAMEMPWATWNGCREAVPPAYTEFIGHQLITFVTAECAA
jgi:DNA (cytosine-5)-methyltransferase 1